jgi:hypothetical protein
VHLNDGVTFYARHGELIGRGAQILAVLGLLLLIAWRFLPRQALPIAKPDF